VVSAPVRSEPSAGRSSRDFFSELIKASQSGRAGFLLERDRWLRGLRVDGREELLFEFEMLLRAIERSFNVHNLPLVLAAEPLVARDFAGELYDVRDAVDQAIRIARKLLNPGADQRMVFRRYVESRLSDDLARRALREEELDQDTPEESLFVLRQSFEALRAILDQLLRLGDCGYALYSDVGTLLLREIVLNRYFRPFRSLEFRLEYDRIKSVAILEALAQVDAQLRRPFTVAFLGLFRLLHYLSFVARESEEPPARGRVLLALIRSEGATLARFLQDELAAQATLKRHKAVALRCARDLVAESDRVANEIVKPAGRDPLPLRDAAAQLGELLGDLIALLARALDPKLAGEELFARLVSRAERSGRLRQDLWILATLCENLEQALRHCHEAEAERGLFAVRAFLDYFHQVSYQLLRFADFEPFDRLAQLLHELPQLPPGPAARERLADDAKELGKLVNHTFVQVSRRADLGGRPFDEEAALTLLEQFLVGPAA
jgi:hypothetical protein